MFDLEELPESSKIFGKLSGTLIFAISLRLFDSTIQNNKKI
jgi:hypothetical protein